MIEGRALPYLEISFDSGKTCPVSYAEWSFSGDREAGPHGWKMVDRSTHLCNLQCVLTKNYTGLQNRGV